MGAVAHLQETLQHRMAREQDSLAGSGAAGHSEVKAVVHRGPEAKTLDGQSIKQYESIKLNQYHLGPYETIKPSRLKRKGSASAAGGATAGVGGQGSGDIIATLDPSATKPPLMGPKPNLEKKRDSFEGHEEAVRTIVEAVQESRKQQQQQQQQQPSNSKRTNNSDTT